jgi:hemolysin D
LQAARARALLGALANEQFPYLHPMPDIAQGRWREAGRHLEDQWHEYEAKRSEIDATIRRYVAELPLAEQRARDYAELAIDHDVSLHAASEKEQARLDIEGQILEAQRRLLVLLAETRKNAQESLNEAQRRISTSEKEVARAGVHSELLQLVAPVDGTVQQLTVHTVGAAVPAAQPLMQIVPSQDVVEVEAFLENKDVGFVSDGQPAQVNLEAFEYTKYGTIPAKVTHISQDAIQDEKKGLLYAGKVALDRSIMLIDGRRVQLSPGLSASVEIKTGDRRVIEYVLSPLMQHVHDSFNER